MTHSLTLAAVAKRPPAGGLDSVALKELFSDPAISSPLMLLSRGEVARNYRRLKDALRRVEIHYAVKPNNHAAIVDEVHRCGGNFDVCSAGEIETVLRIGANPASLVHSHPVKSTEEFDRAADRGWDAVELRDVSLWTDCAIAGGYLGRWVSLRKEKKEPQEVSA